MALFNKCVVKRKKIITVFMLCFSDAPGLPVPHHPSLQKQHWHNHHYHNYWLNK